MKSFMIALAIICGVTSLITNTMDNRPLPDEWAFIISPLAQSPENKHELKAMALQTVKDEKKEKLDDRRKRRQNKGAYRNLNPVLDTIAEQKALSDAIKKAHLEIYQSNTLIPTKK